MGICRSERWDARSAPTTTSNAMHNWHTKSCAGHRLTLHLTFESFKTSSRMYLIPYCRS